jgi:predicted nucleotidyltransferase
MSVEEIQKKITEQIEKMPGRNKVRKISLFGSYLHGDQREGSDVDLLLELKEAVGYFELVRMQGEFEKTLGRKVDLVTPKALSKYFRDKVLKEAQKIYEN